MTTLHQHHRPHGTRHITGPNYYYATSTELTLIRGGRLIDLAAVERALNGIPVTLTDDDAYEAGRQLAARGYQPYTIGQRIGVHVRHVRKWEEAGWPEQRPDNTSGRRRGTQQAA